MPFRVPERYWSVDVRPSDPDTNSGGDLQDYVRWLLKEYRLATFALAEQERMDKEIAREMRKKAKAEGK